MKISEHPSFARQKFMKEVAALVTEKTGIEYEARGTKIFWVDKRGFVEKVVDFFSLRVMNPVVWLGWGHDFNTLYTQSREAFDGLRELESEHVTKIELVPRYSDGLRGC